MDEYVYLFSNFDAIKYYGKPNKIGHFKNQLACNLPINQHWKVALTEIIYTKSWYNVQFEQDIKLISEFGIEINLKSHYKIIPGFYESADILINEINKTMTSIPNIIPPILLYNSRENYCYIKSGRYNDVKIFPDLGEEVENMLGIRNRNSFLLEYDYNYTHDSEKIII